MAAFRCPVQKLHRVTQGIKDGGAVISPAQSAKRPIDGLGITGEVLCQFELAVEFQDGHLGAGLIEDLPQH